MMARRIIVMVMELRTQGKGLLLRSCGLWARCDLAALGEELMKVEEGEIA